MIRGQPIGVLLALALVPVFGLGLLILAFMWLRSIGSRIAIYPRYILVEHGILNKDRTETAIAGIRSVNIKQSFLNRLFNVGSILIYTAGDKPEAEINHIYLPHRARDLIRRQQTG